MDLPDILNWAQLDAQRITGPASEASNFNDLKVFQPQNVMVQCIS
jgi:hypothetical protein